MTKEEKFQYAQELAGRFKANPNFYVVNIAGFSVEKTNALRRTCFNSNIKIETAKNTLVRKALESIDANLYGEIFPILKESTTIMFTGDDTKEPAKIIKKLREGNNELPAVKAAFIEETVFVGGDNLLDTLINLKSKRDLLGEIIGLLQSPATNVISALQSGGNNLAGILKTLSEK